MMRAMQNEPDSLRLAAWRAFLEVHAHVTDRLEQELEAERRLPLTWYDVLVQLQEAPGHRLRMTELANAVLLSKSGLTRLVDRMCAAHLVERNPDPEDRRVTHVTLTDTGYMRLQDAAPIHMRGIDLHFAQYLTDEEASCIRAAFTRINSHFTVRDSQAEWRDSERETG